MYRMPEKLASADLISAIKIEENGEEQSVHCDAEKPGNSVLTALVERQSVLVLFGGFRGMVILKRLTPDRIVIIAKRQPTSSVPGWQL